MFNSLFVRWNWHGEQYSPLEFNDYEAEDVMAAQGDTT